MEYRFEENSVIIEIPERVSEMNAEEIRDGLMDIIERNDDKSVVLDAEKLIYISSSGLRAILEVKKKKKKNIRVVNMSKIVRDVFDLTGFSDIFEIAETIRNMTLEEAELICESVNGSVFRYKKGMMVKVFREDVPFEEVEAERLNTKNALICGVPTVISFSIVKVNGRYGILYEEVDAKTLAQAIAEDPKRTMEYATMFAKFMKELHQIEVPGDMLPNIKSRYREWLEMTKSNMNNITWEKMQGLIESVADTNTFVHGDINLNNVYLVGDELMLVDMSSCGYGHPIFDLQAIYATLIAIEDKKPGYVEKHLGLYPEHARLFWNTFLNRYVDDISSESGVRTIAKDGRVIIADKLDILLEQYYILKEVLVEAVIRLENKE